MKPQVGFFSLVYEIQCLRQEVMALKEIVAMSEQQNDRHLWEIGYPPSESKNVPQTVPGLCQEQISIGKNKILTASPVFLTENGFWLMETYGAMRR